MSRLPASGGRVAAGGVMPYLGARGGPWRGGRGGDQPGDLRLPGQGVRGGICRSARGARGIGRPYTIGVAGRSARVRPAERGDQGGDSLELIALRVEVEGAEADDDVARSGRDVAAETFDDARGSAADDRLDLLQLLQWHAVAGVGIVIERPAAVLDAAVDSYGYDRRGRDGVGGASGLGCRVPYLQQAGFVVGAVPRSGH